MKIRLAEPGDAPAVQAIYAPMVQTSAVSFEVEPPGANEIEARIQATMPTYPWLVLERGNEVLGYAYGGRFAARPAYRWAVETSVYVAAESRGRGVGRALYGALLPLLREQGFFQCLGGIALPNRASVALHEWAGFKQVGVYRAVGWKLGSWHDVGWWQMSLRTSPDEAMPAIPLDQMPESKINAALSKGIGYLI